MHKVKPLQEEGPQVFQILLLVQVCILCGVTGTAASALLYKKTRGDCLVTVYIFIRFLGVFFFLYVIFEAMMSFLGGTTCLALQKAFFLF